MASAVWGRSLWPGFRFEILPPNMSELRLVLLGNDWSLKALVANLLLGNTEFDLFTQHDKCVKLSGTFQDKPVTVIYTPDQLISTISQQELQQFIQDIKYLSAPGPHVFLLVLQPEHFTEEHKSRLQSVLENLSEQAFHHSLLLLMMEYNQWLLMSFMFNPHIQDMINRCRNRRLNIEPYLHYELHREKLFSSICDILKANNGAHVSLDPSEEQDTGLRITLIGKTGSGKSSSANTILGIKAFTTKPSQLPVTKVCQRELTTFDGRRVAVVDTPGLFDSNMTNNEVDVERLKCVSLLDPGPHVFLMVLQLGRFTDEERKVVELIKKGFGERVVKFMIILFTHGDQLEHPETSIEEFIEDCDENFKQLLSECGNRFHVFNNRNSENRAQVKDLLQKIDEMMKKNGGACYTNNMLLEADAATKREMERKIKEMERKIEEIERKFEQREREREERESEEEEGERTEVE